VEPDDDRRWLAFCDSVFPWHASSCWVPDLLHLNECHAALIASRPRSGVDRAPGATTRLLTNHNLATNLA